MSSYLPQNALVLCGSRYHMDDAAQTGEFSAASHPTALTRGGWGSRTRYLVDCSQSVAMSFVLLFSTRTGARNPSSLAR